MNLCLQFGQKCSFCNWEKSINFTYPDLHTNAWRRRQTEIDTAVHAQLMSQHRRVNMHINSTSQQEPAAHTTIQHVDTGMQTVDNRQSITIATQTTSTQQSPTFKPVDDTSIRARLPSVSADSICLCSNQLTPKLYFPKFLSNISNDWYPVLEQ
jgi:hypothetical protein